ncbi:LCP family protein [Olsenella sp. Marseille-P4559]|uniref:LCP family protein n=1 Tax=Olsenella sp. Marseille-P4559 TaxID=2364795 RepID=UPI00103146C3|nr:LCP family protein [Olsenella sp. Marseille-P4559]
MSKHMKAEGSGSDIDASDKYSRNNVERYSKRCRRHRLRRSVARGVVAALVVMLVGGGVAFARWISSVQSRMNNGQVITPELEQSLSAATDGNEPSTPNDPYYVLLLGTDGRPGETDYRADTIILARIDPPNKRVTLLSIPRDTMVEWKGTTMKINGVHTYDGAAGMVQIVSEKCGVPISHYAEISFDGLATLTNAMGGVTVDVDQSMKDTENFDVVTELQPGVQTLDGEEALFYCRCRHFPDGDYTRMHHQRSFIKAMLNQLLSTNDPTKIVNLVDATADVITTDLSVSEIVSLASEMVGMDTENDIYAAYAPSEPKDVNGVSYVVADWDALAEVMKVIDAGKDPSSFNADQHGYTDGGSSSENAGPTSADATSSAGTVSASSPKSAT